MISSLITYRVLHHCSFIMKPVCRRQDAVVFQVTSMEHDSSAAAASQAPGAPLPLVHHLTADHMAEQHTSVHSSEDDDDCDKDSDDGQYDPPRCWDCGKAPADLQCRRVLQVGVLQRGLRDVCTHIRDL